MAGNGGSEGLAALRRQLEALERAGRLASAVLPFGLAAIDTALPQGGLALGALHELAGAGPAAEDGAIAAAFLAGILARLAPPRPVLWCLAAGDLYGPGLAACGLAPERLILARAQSERGVLWAMEEGLRSAALGAVIGEVEALPSAASRRLQLAAEASGGTAFALRRWRNGERAARQRAGILDGGGVRCDGSCHSGCRAGRSTGGASVPASLRRMSPSCSPPPSATGGW